LFRVTSAKLFRDTAYEARNASMLKATALISPETFSLPEYTTGG
jgi:hypothetical protein